MNKKFFTLIELVIYIGLSSVIGVFLFSFANQFYNSLKRSEQLSNFSTNYKSLIHKMISDSYDGREFLENNSGSVYIVNQGNITQLSGYRGIACTNSGISFTRIENSTGSINWEKFDLTFDGFQCKSIVGSGNHLGAWFSFNIGVLGNDYQYKYFFSR